MSETLTCLQCQLPFAQRKDELFCCDDCRIYYWKTKKINVNYTTDMQLSDLRDAIQKTRANANDIKRHCERVEKEYSDWEDRVRAIEDKIYELEIQVGLEEKEMFPKMKVVADLDFDALAILDLE